MAFKPLGVKQTKKQKKLIEKIKENENDLDERVRALSGEFVNNNEHLFWNFKPPSIEEQFKELNDNYDTLREKNIELRELVKRLAAFI